MIQLEPNEQVLRIVRRHWFVFILRALPIGILALLPYVLYEVFVRVVLPQAQAIPLPALPWGALSLYVYALWLLLLWMWFFVRWTNYYLNAWVVTEKRIVDVEQIGLFSRMLSTASLSRIQDITIDVNGFIATMLGFGTVHVQTAGEIEEIIIRDAADPQTVKELILRAADARNEQAAARLQSVQAQPAQSPEHDVETGV